MESVLAIRRFAAGGYFFVLLGPAGDVMATSEVFDRWADCYAFVETVRQGMPGLRVVDESVFASAEAAGRSVGRTRAQNASGAGNTAARFVVDSG